MWTAVPILMYIRQTVGTFICISYFFLFNLKTAYRYTRSYRSYTYFSDHSTVKTKKRHNMCQLLAYSGKF